MKNVKKVLGILLTVIFTVSLMAGCSKKPQEPQSGDKNAPVTIKFLAFRNAPETQTEVVKALEEKLNVKFEFTVGTDDDYDQKLNLALASQEMPDVFLTWWVDEVKDKGTVHITEEEFKTNMPKTYEKTVKYAESVGLSKEKLFKLYSDKEGKLTGIPCAWVGGQNAQTTAIRQDILDELGKKVPQTFQDWDDVLKAYKTKYPNKYPLIVPGKGIQWQAFGQFFNGAGLKYNSWMYNNGEVFASITKPEYLEVLTWIQKWIKAGYVDPEWVLTDQQTMYKKWRNGDLLALYAGLTEPVDSGDIIPGSAPDTLIKNVPTAKISYISNPELKTGVAGSTQCWFPFHGDSVGFGKQLEKDKDKLYRIMKAMDNMTQDEENWKTALYGIEGKHWDKAADGSIQYKPEFNPTSSPDVKKKEGFGFFDVTHWFVNPDMTNKYMPGTQKRLEEKLYGKGGIYEYKEGKLFPGWNAILGGKILSESGEDLTKKYATLGADFDTVWAETVLGKKSIEDFKKYVEDWKKNGGDELKQNANRQFIPVWKK